MSHEKGQQQARTMPHSDDLKVDGKFSKQKFVEGLPAAAKALSSGETKFHKVIIYLDKSGKPCVDVHRDHNHNKEGLDPRIAVGLQNLLLQLDAEGVTPIADVNETPADSSGKDVLTITSA